MSRNETADMMVYVLSRIALVVFIFVSISLISIGGCIGYVAKGEEPATIGIAIPEEDEILDNRIEKAKKQYEIMRDHLNALEEERRIAKDKKKVSGKLEGDVRITYHLPNDEQWVYDKITINVLRIVGGEIPRVDPYQKVVTDDMGGFELNEIPYGSYLLGVEYKGQWSYQSLEVGPDMDTYSLRLRPQIYPR